MKISLIAIGNELLNGKTQDRNGHYLAKKCIELNYNLISIQTVGDNEQSVHKAISSALESSDIVITCGGLGPTQDDYTKKFVAKFFQKKIIPNNEAEQIVLSHFKRAQREYDYNRYDYHAIPEGMQALTNPVGLAPGLLYSMDKQLFMSLPGVPSEFNQMIEDELSKLASQLHGDKITKQEHLIIKTEGLGESKIFFELCPDLWDKLSKYGPVSSLPHHIGVDIGVHLTGDNIEKQKQEIIHLVTTGPLAPAIWHIGPESLVEVIIKKASDKKLTIGFAESCTGGLLSSEITNMSGASSVFMGTVVSYSNDIKINLLDVNPKLIKEFGAVSIEVARSMAIGAKEHLGVDIAVSTSGIAGPLGGSEKKPVGLVTIGMASKNGSFAKAYQFKGNRIDLKTKFAHRALMELLRQIENY